MFTKCPACGSMNVRRSSLRASETTSGPRLRSPYRCRDCDERFWVVSRHANYLVGLACVAVAAAIVAWTAVGGQDKPRQEPAQIAAAAVSFSDTSTRAEREDPLAELRLSHMYARGDGVGVDKRAAQMWLERAAQHGNTDAQYELGNAFRDGLGVIQDYERAAYWLRMSAIAGNADAQYALGQMFHSGLGVAPDNVRAYMWFNLAAAQGVAGASAQRDAVRRILQPAEVVEAQAEARRLSQASGWRQPQVDSAMP